MERKVFADKPNGGLVGRLLSLSDRNVINKSFDLLADNSMPFVVNIRQVIDRQMGLHSQPPEVFRPIQRILGSIRHNAAAKDGVVVWMNPEQVRFTKAVVREVVMLAAEWYGGKVNSKSPWSDEECLRVYREHGITLDKL